MAGDPSAMSSPVRSKCDTRSFKSAFSQPSGGSHVTVRCTVNFPVVPASEEEIASWCWYEGANGAFFYGVLNFIPLLLLEQGERIARVRSCRRALGMQAGASGEACHPYDGTELSQWCQCLLGEAIHLEGEEQVVHLFGFIPVTFANVYAAATSISVIVQLVLMVLCSSMADYGDSRHRLLIITTLFGGLACCLVGLSGQFYNEPGMNVTALLFMVANVAFGMAMVFYNAYLPLLVCSHPSVLASRVQGEEARVRIESEISGRGIKYGMSGQLLFLVLAGVLQRVCRLSLPSLVVIGGLWSGGLGVWLAMRLGKRPGPPRPAGLSYARLSWLQLRSTCQKAPHLRQLFLFLGAYFIFSDGCSTVASQASTLAQQEFQLGAQVVIALVIVVSLSAICGCAIAFWAQTKFGVGPKQILISALCLQMCLPLGALVIQTTLGLFMMAMLFGLASGPQQAYTRCLFSACLPRSHEAEFFGFFEITNHGTAWTGPLIMSIVGTHTGSFRKGYASLSILFLVGIVALAAFLPGRAAKERRAFEEAETEAFIGGAMELPGMGATCS